MDFADLDVAMELRLPAVPGELVRQGLDLARTERWAERLHDRDTSLWSSDPRVQAEIASWLGWLDAPDHFAGQVAALEGFGDGIRDAGFTTAVVMGMGGSSLVAETLGRTFGSTPGYLEQRILDSTHPLAVSRLVDDLAPLATLWIVATKSGRTTESLAFQADAWARVDAVRDREGLGDTPGSWMVAITDPGRSLETIPHHDQLREVFLNPTDIGGRYSAISYTGLVPAALVGIDLDALIASATAMLARTREPEPARNPGIALGVALGILAKSGRNKVTFLLDPDIAAFGPWVEQLLAESTGKHGIGIVPIDGEPLGAVKSYDDDRVFVRIRLAGSTESGGAGETPVDRLLDGLEAAGHPVIGLTIADPIDLAGEFVRWEVATAIAGAVLGVDPFDQPNVEESKELTRRLLSESPRDDGAAGAEPDPDPVRSGELELHPDAALRLTTGADRTFAGELRRHLARRRPSAYLALQAFLAPSPETDAALARIRARLRDATRCATTAGYGPRYLHSTGQLHKGGPPIGWFLQLTDHHGVEREIPDWPYTFGELIDAQARGDFAALEAHDLPVVRIHLGADAAAGLAALETILDEILEVPRR